MPHLVRGVSTSWAYVPNTQQERKHSLRSHLGSQPRQFPCSRPGPAELPAVHCYCGPSGHPPAFGDVTAAYLAPRCFSLGLGGLHRLRVQTFLACCRHYPAGIERGLIQISAPDVAFANNREAQLPEFVTHEAYTTFDTCGPQGRSPGQARVCQMAPPPALACKASSQLHDSDSFHGRTFTCWFGPAFPVTAVTVTAHGPRPTGPRASGCHSYRGGVLRMSLVSIAETRSGRSWAATGPHDRADVVLIGWSAFEVSFETIFAEGWGILIELAIEMTQVFRRHTSTQ